MEIDKLNENKSPVRKRKRSHKATIINKRDFFNYVGATTRNQKKRKYKLFKIFYQERITNIVFHDADQFLLDLYKNFPTIDDRSKTDSTFDFKLTNEWGNEIISIESLVMFDNTNDNTRLKLDILCRPNELCQTTTNKEWLKFKNFYRKLHGIFLVELKQNFSCDVTQLIAQYADSNPFFLGNRVDLLCSIDHKFWTGTIIGLTYDSIHFVYDGWSHSIGKNVQKDNALQFVFELGSKTGQFGNASLEYYSKPWTCIEPICRAENPSWVFNCINYNTRTVRCGAKREIATNSNQCRTCDNFIYEFLQRCQICENEA